VGGILIVATMMLTWMDVAVRGGIVVPHGQLPAPDDALQWVYRWAARLITPICWTGYLLLFDGLLTALAWRRGEAGGCVRRRPWLFAVTYITSIWVWCFFDWVNFGFLRAWFYHGIPPWPVMRYVGYFVAFGAISPAMFLAAQYFQRLGLWRLNTTASPRVNHRVAWALLLVNIAICAGPVNIWAMRSIESAGWSQFGWTAGLLLGFPMIVLVLTRSLLPTSLATGLAFMVWPFLVQAPVACMTLWVALVFLLDPINAWFGRPSILRDWQAGRWGRTVALMAGGALCGLLWEFWNYWAVTKWTYHLPFLGPLEQYRYFEMPLVGFLGFLPFAIECWVALQLLLIVLHPVTEPLPGEYDVL
jgi:hypothetical protein